MLFIVGKIGVTGHTALYNQPKSLFNTLTEILSNNGCELTWSVMVLQNVSNQLERRVLEKRTKSNLQGNIDTQKLELSQK